MCVYIPNIFQKRLIFNVFEKLTRACFSQIALQIALHSINYNYFKTFVVT